MPANPSPSAPDPAAALQLQLDRTCAALAHRGRRAIVELLARHAGLTAGEVAACFPGAARQTVSGHLRVLRAAGLVTAQRVPRPALDPAAPPEVRALQLLAQAGPADGRELHYRAAAWPLELLQLWAARHGAPAAPAAACQPDGAGAADSTAGILPA